jgi:chromosome segregation ATPase
MYVHIFTQEKKNNEDLENENKIDKNSILEVEHILDMNMEEFENLKTEIKKLKKTEKKLNFLINDLQTENMDLKNQLSSDSDDSNDDRYVYEGINIYVSKYICMFIHLYIGICIYKYVYLDLKIK